MKPKFVNSEVFKFNGFEVKDPDLVRFLKTALWFRGAAHGLHGEEYIKAQYRLEKLARRARIALNTPWELNAHWLPGYINSILAASDEQIGDQSSSFYWTCLASLETV
jgi:hypothetical protein